MTEFTAASNKVLELRAAHQWALHVNINNWWIDSRFSVFSRPGCRRSTGSLDTYQLRERWSVCAAMCLYVKEQLHDDPDCATKSENHLGQLRQMEIFTIRKHRLFKSDRLGWISEGVAACVYWHVMNSLQLSLFKAFDTVRHSSQIEIW